VEHSTHFSMATQGSHGASWLCTGRSARMLAGGRRGIGAEDVFSPLAHLRALGKLLGRQLCADLLAQSAG